MGFDNKEYGEEYSETIPICFTWELYLAALISINSHYTVYMIIINFNKQINEIIVFESNKVD